MFPSLCATTFLSFAATAFAQNSLTLSAPTSASKTNGISPYLDASFAGFGIEPSNLYSFTGGSDTNAFSIQLLQNLADFSGAPPHIRLGGNTQDYFIYDASWDKFYYQNNPNPAAQGTIAADSMIIGPKYFEVLDRLPKGTPITYGLNLAYDNEDYLDQLVTMAKAAVEGMKNVKLYSFEVGNEPDLYLQNLFRNGTWNGQTYTQEFLTRAEAVYNQVLKPAGFPSEFFEPPATASTIGTTFEISQLVKDGLLDGLNGVKYCTIWNQHDYFYFIGVSGTSISLDILLDLDGTNRQFAYWEKQVGIAINTGLPYALREMSSVGPIGMHGVSDTFGAALWTLNFLLYMASISVASVQMHMTDNSNASAWQPIEMYGNAPFVRPQYYAHAAMAQLIGNGNGTTQIGEIDTSRAPSGYSGRVRAYTAYANDNLQSLVLINSKTANVSVSDKASFQFNLNLGKNYANKDIYLSYLTADGADSLSGTTWNGMSFSDKDGKASTVNTQVTTVTTSSSGTVSIPVRDSQAIIANIGFLLGSNAVLTSNGTRPGSTGKKSSGGSSSTKGASTAVFTGIVTTALALASSLSGGQAEETGTSRQQDDAEGTARRKNWVALAVALTTVVLGFVCFA